MTKRSREVRLDGPYVDFIRAASFRRWRELAESYRERHGQHVPVLTEDVVQEFADRNETDVGRDRWLTAALSQAAAFRSDLRSDEFRRVYALAAKEDQTLQLRPQPIEILVAIEAIRPPSHSNPTRTQTKATRKRGRPPWERETYKRQLGLAQRDAEMRGDDPARLTHVVKYFRTPDGEEVSIGWLYKLNRRLRDDVSD